MYANPESSATPAPSGDRRARWPGTPAPPSGRLRDERGSTSATPISVAQKYTIGRGVEPVHGVLVPERVDRDGQAGEPAPSRFPARRRGPRGRRAKGSPPPPPRRRPGPARSGRSPSSTTAAGGGEQRPAAACHRVDQRQVAVAVAALEGCEVGGVDQPAAGHEGHGGHARRGAGHEHEGGRREHRRPRAPTPATRTPRRRRARSWPAGSSRRGRPPPRAPARAPRRARARLLSPPRAWRRRPGPRPRPSRPRTGDRPVGPVGELPGGLGHLHRGPGAAARCTRRSRAPSVPPSPGRAAPRASRPTTAPQRSSRAPYSSWPW